MWLAMWISALLPVPNLNSATHERFDFFSPAIRSETPINSLVE
jgi:hypothetical protein